MMLSFIKKILGSIHHGKRPDDSKRSPDWHRAEVAHKKIQPRCQFCGRLDHNDVHHIESFEKNPARELDPSNHWTLCRPPGTVYHSDHFVKGHEPHGAEHPNWKTFNPEVVADCLKHQEELGVDWTGGHTPGFKKRSDGKGWERILS